MAKASKKNTAPAVKDRTHDLAEDMHALLSRLGEACDLGSKHTGTFSCTCGQCLVDTALFRLETQYLGAGKKG